MKMMNRHVADPGGVSRLRSALVKRSITPRTVVDRCLKRIDETEEFVRGWRIIDREGALAQADRLETDAAQGLLHGVPIAVKDVIDVAGFPTRAGSRSREHIAPAAADAQVVKRLRQAGAVILGKAHTTEFAFFDGPPPTRNPYDLARTPGGSSSGPAAIVAAGMVPAALGTQTAGSVSRPAAYCGIAAFKPSGQSWSNFGVVPFAPSFDTVGVFGYRVSDAVYVARALMPDYLPHAAMLTAPLRIGILTDPLLREASNAVTALTETIGSRLHAAGVTVENVTPDVTFADLNALHVTAREYEIGRVHVGLLSEPPDTVTASLCQAIRRGGAISHEQYLEAANAIETARARFWEQMSPWDAVIVPAAPDVAPVGMATGDARFIIPMTALNGPIVSIPTGFDQAMPLGIMLAAAPGRDLAVLDIAERLAPLIEIAR
jgi:aspartyl-tRNA(Asn)/glutamyl-tRNA(Gln) amidotransferase subunit A